ncbi:MAG: hypothetical protein NVSMB17_01870 [Candidatus Dormibacteria bacterium]
MTAGAAPALAADHISYFSGSAQGAAAAATINPNAVLDVRLSALQNVLNTLNSVPVAGTTGLGASINKTIGSTLNNPTAPITVVVDEASASGTAAQGTALTDGAASSTAVRINAASLASEVDLLNRALQAMPSGTVDALRSALAPVIAADKTGKLGPAFDTVLPSLAKPITGALGSPTVNVLQSVTAKFGETAKGHLTTVEQGGLLTPGSRLELQPFEAHALASDAYASNAVDTLAMLPGGKLNVASPQQLLNSLKLVEATLVAVENAVSQTTASVGVDSLTTPVTGLVFPVVNGVVGTINSTVTTALTTTDLTQVNSLLKLINAQIDLLGGLNGLQLNDLVGNNGANALSTVGRTADAVTANGIGQVAHVDVVKINDPTLKSLLGSELLSVDGIKATASVTLDGVNPARQTTSGTLLDVKVAGHSLTELTAGKVALDDILPAGTSCTINVPGASTCHGIQLVVPPAQVSDALGTLQGALGTNIAVPTLVNVTLTRGIGVVDQANSAKYGRADIAVLQATSDINCDAVSKLAGMLQSTQSLLASNLNLHLAACGLGITDASPNAAPAARKSNASVATNATGNVHLINVSLGVAHADLSLDKASDFTHVTPGPVPPTTGNDLLILAAVALAAVAGGVALQVRKARA